MGGGGSFDRSPVRKAYKNWVRGCCQIPLNAELGIRSMMPSWKMRSTSSWSSRSNSRINTPSLRTSLGSPAELRAAPGAAGEPHIIGSFLVPGIASCSSATILVSQTILGDEQCMQLACRKTVPLQLWSVGGGGGWGEDE